MAKIETIPNACEDVEKLDNSHITVGNENDTAFLENSLAGFFKS